MARIQITLEDHPTKGVDVTINPNFKSLLSKKDSRNVTSAEAYALFLIQQMKDKSQVLAKGHARKPGIIGKIKAAWKQNAIEIQ